MELGSVDGAGRSIEVIVPRERLVAGRRLGRGCLMMVEPVAQKSAKKWPAWAISLLWVLIELLRSLAEGMESDE